jgi:hypothetical protein
MSIAGVLPYFRTRMNTLGYKEWTDALDFENIPDTIIDGTYHLDFGSTIKNQNNQIDVDLGQTVTVRLFCKGYRDTSATRDKLIANAQDAFCDIIDPRNATIGPAVKDVEFTSMNIIALDDSNTNTMYAEMLFEARTFLQYI